MMIKKPKDSALIAEKVVIYFSQGNEDAKWLPLNTI